MSIQSLREKREAKSEEYRGILDRNPGKLSPKAASQLNELESEIEAISARIDYEQRTLEEEAAKIVKQQGGILGAKMDNKEAVRSLAAFYRTGDTSGFGPRAALTESGDGGVLVPHELAEIIGTQQQKFSPLRQICTVVNSSTTASKYVQPVNTGGLGSGWVGETDARTATATPTLEEVVFPDAEVYANLPISQWIEEDAQLGSWLVQEIGKEFSRVEGAAFISGNGTKQPKGFLAYTTAATADDTRAFGTLQHIETASTSALASDELIDLIYTLKSAYRQNAHFVMNGLTLSKVRKLKDSQNRYLWEPGLSGQPQMLAGYPILECDDMPDVGAGLIPIAFGDFRSAYKIIDRVMMVLRDPYSNKPFVNFYARKRVSGAVVDSNAIKLLKMKA
ncbi:MAG: phage major capsid protein [Clostridia bacterium]|nr:phage major capsid protein [Clostridia bacterium]